MPELPEVETIKHGLKPHLEREIVVDVIVRRATLRWPIPDNLKDLLFNQCILDISRRGKYLLFKFITGTLLIHLGMSGRLQLVSTCQPLKPHDHVDFIFSSDRVLRYNDPRRFGAILWTNAPIEDFPLLKSLGVEPLDNEFTADYLKEKTCNRHVDIKSLIMNSHVVVGVGNIYAAEALFLAKIHPLTPARHLSCDQHIALVDAIQKTLQAAIAAGGTTLKDFVNSQGKPGYFSQQLNVYGCEHLPCVQCGSILLKIKQAQRTTVFCQQCQI